MNRVLLLLFILLFNSISIQTFAQEASDEKLFKPTISAGYGILTFYGDVGRDNQGYSFLRGRPGYDLRLSLPVTKGVDIHFDAIIGQLSANERFKDRNLNFISDIKTFSFQLSYNFEQIRKSDSKIRPFISAGFSAFDFLSRSDLKDANGNPYFYWNDGTIRNVAENSPNAGSAEIIIRDYNYESGIRDLNLDGFGLYRQNAYAVPVGVGINFEITRHVGLKLGSTMFFTFTNYIDNVTDNSIIGRTGNNRNDWFLYTNAALTINLNPENDSDGDGIKYAPTLEEKNQLFALAVEDSDRDGIRDIFDECPNTEAGVEVDEKGCPLDRDADGVPDYLDKEPDSVMGAFVDENGVTLTDEEILKRYQIYSDSTGEYTANVVSSTYTGTTLNLPTVKKTERPGRTYAVRVGESTTGISPDEVDYILSIPDVQTIQKGDTTFYVIGNYDNIPDAVKRKLELGDEGIDGTLIAREEGDVKPLTNNERSSEARSTVLAGNENIGRTPTDTKGVVYRVQLGAFKFNLSKNVFADVDDLLVIKGDDELTRYATGSYSNLNEAIKRKTNLVTQGYEGAFVTAYRDGKRIKLNEAGATYVRPDVVETSTSEATPGAISKTNLKFNIQLGAFRERVPSDILNSYISLGGVKPKKDGDLTKYVYGTYNSYEEAQTAVATLKANGFDGAFVVADLKGKLIPAKDAINLMGD